jgi:type II secretory pathway pseudopilin PulG
MLRSRARQGGFTYLGLVIFIAIIGMVGAATLKIGSLLQRAAAEEELLEIGAAFSAALQSYAAATPRGTPPQPPPTLQDLLKDPRFPGVRRHLRKIFVDPMTGKAEWGIVYLGDKKGVLAVYSLSTAKPLKIANFDSRFQNFENKEKISDWKFMATGQGLQTPGGQAAPGMPKPPAAPVPPTAPSPAPGSPPAAAPEAPPAEPPPPPEAPPEEAPQETPQTPSQDPPQDTPQELPQEPQEPPQQPARR